MNPTTGSENSSGSKYVPPKPYSTLTADEKIQRIYEQVKYLQQTVNRQGSLIQRTRQLIATHSHNPMTGDVVQLVKEYDDSIGGLNGLCADSSSSEQAYF